MNEAITEPIWAGGVPGGGAPPLSYEWLVTNGVGGYAAGTSAGVPTRRYHGLLISALPNPLGRVVMLSSLREELHLPNGSSVRLGGWSRREWRSEDRGVLREFGLDLDLPVWRYRFGDAALERRVMMPHGRNTVHVSYRLTAGESGGRLRLRPAFQWREQEKPVSDESGLRYSLSWSENRLEISAVSRFPPLRLWASAVRSRFVIEPVALEHVLYPVEEERGYPSTGELWSPGYYVVDLPVGSEITLVASTEDWPVLLALSPGEAKAASRERRAMLLARAAPSVRSGPGGRLVLAADAFVVSPGYRLHEVERARAAGKELRTVLAGFHWFTDWGRDTMISLEGLTLLTGRFAEARQILLTFGRYVKDGLIPNMFPVGSNEGLYNTADATLWFFHAVGRYLQFTHDSALLAVLRPTLAEIVEAHLAGTTFGIGVDPEDGLLRQGSPTMPLTWMDAVFEGQVITPRRGKAVEINALWYNAVRLMAHWADADGSASARAYAELSTRVADSFNRRFWNASLGCLYDVVDGEDGADASFRPNQIFAVSLPYPVLRRDRWDAVVEAVRQRLLTPYGLRSLAPGEPDYHSTYHGNLRSRDSAYHQGTVWAWLIGPFVDAWLRVHPANAPTAGAFLAALIEHLDEFGAGSVAEVFDAEPPYTPRGCIAQAWSVAELLRALAAVSSSGADDPAASNRTG
jgi:predicted glycogen debranching enzyme